MILTRQGYKKRTVIMDRYFPVARFSQVIHTPLGTPSTRRSSSPCAVWDLAPGPPLLSHVAGLGPSRAWFSFFVSAV